MRPAWSWMDSLAHAQCLAAALKTAGSSGKITLRDLFHPITAGMNAWAVDRVAYIPLERLTKFKLHKFSGFDSFHCKSRRFFVECFLFWGGEFIAPTKDITAYKSRVPPYTIYPSQSALSVPGKKSVNPHKFQVKEFLSWFLNDKHGKLCRKSTLLLT